ncbi:MAG: FliG C-terminal domain-containing protein [Pseudomonadota bacterium]
MDYEPTPISLDGALAGAADLPPLPRIEAGGPAKANVGLSGPEKAAVIVRLMAGSGAKLSLHSMPDAVQADLIRQVAQIGNVPPDVVRAIADEFAEKVETAAMLGAGGLQEAISLLGDSVDAGVAARLRQQSFAAGDVDPWGRIAEKDAETLRPVVEAESVEVGAVILSKLGVSTAAELLGLLPGDRARRITYAVSQISGIRPSVVRRIGLGLADVLEIQPARAFDDGPVERVGAILNSSRGLTRDTVLAGLDEDDADFAEEVRRAIFTFANIPERIAPRDVPKITRQVEQDVLVRALAAAEPQMPEATEFILGAISQRMADALRGEIEDLGEFDEDAGDEAMSDLIAVIRELEAEGEIHLVAADD